MQTILVTEDSKDFLLIHSNSWTAKNINDIQRMMMGMGATGYNPRNAHFVLHVSRERIVEQTILQIEAIIYQELCWLLAAIKKFKFKG